MYAVASICYFGNAHSPITDRTFDELCMWILENFDACVADGSNMLDESMLRRHSGYDLSEFPKHLHDVAAILIGRPCGCMHCRCYVR